MQTLQRRIATALVAGAIGLPMAAAAQSTSSAPVVSGQKFTSAETDFIKDLAQGGAAEIEFGRVATKKATSPEVRAFGVRMVVDHAVANQQLEQLAASQDIKLPRELTQNDHEMGQKLGAEKAGMPFDKAYMTNQVIDHERALDRIALEMARTNNTQIKQWVRSQLPTLQDHLKQARQINDQLRSQMGATS